MSTSRAESWVVVIETTWLPNYKILLIPYGPLEKKFEDPCLQVLSQTLSIKNENIHNNYTHKKTY